MEERWEGPRVNACADIIPWYKGPHIDDEVLIIVGRKPTDPIGMYRFIGGHADPDDLGYAYTAVRELMEETNIGIFVQSLKYIDNLRVRLVNNPANPTHPDSIITTLYSYRITTYSELLSITKTMKAGSDLCEVKLISLNATKINVEHFPLYTRFINSLNL